MPGALPRVTGTLGHRLWEVLAVDVGGVGWELMREHADLAAFLIRL